jgi:2-polyprenyl-6-hydroxyphenyl methylase/3-demethylubiquinone-9 3-methyltransferase
MTILTFMTEASANVDPRELAKFEVAAARWWDREGEFKTLHDINPLRLRYIDERAPLRGKRVVDIGCGGGILSESLAEAGAKVAAIDASVAAIGTAQLHQYQSGSDVDYLQTTPEVFAAQHPGEFDVVTCMEMLEHVPEPSAVIKACKRLVSPGGHVFFSTLNRTFPAYAAAVIGAEYVFKLLPKGTHDYRRFIRPAELAAWIREAGLTLRELNGMRYNPFTGACALTATVSINYLVHAVRES